MDYPGHNAVTDDLSWRTVALWIGSPVEVIFRVVDHACCSIRD